MVLFSSPCVIATVHDLIVGADDIEGALMVGSFCTMTTAIGIFLLVFGLKSPREAELVMSADLEKRVLQSASQQGGFLTVPRLAMETDLSLAQSEAILDELSRRGYANPQVSSEGAVEYVFQEFRSDRTLDELEFQIERAVAEAEEEQPVPDESG